jgi:hypothetical protein
MTLLRCAAIVLVSITSAILLSGSPAQAFAGGDEVQIGRFTIIDI